MTPERLQRIEAMYHAASELEPEGRRRFLDQACQGDEDLLHEVESLLAQTGSFLDRPVWGAMPSLSAGPAGPTFTPGTRLGPFKIEALLGAGGMGEVFRATDTRLHRAVAIKILSRDQVADPDRKRRFLQEARAASALSHPNIVTLHDIATHNGIDYLVMEYVPGKPLHKLIPVGGMPLPEVIAYAMQIACALAAAHAAGIVHRDIKPANLIVTAEGQVKILDFGLAKLEQRASSPEDETRTMAAPLTGAGMMMGTMAYISPEQARGEDVDARADLFSFGAVLYEMSSGQRAFSRALDWTTPPTNPLPPELRPIVLKLLQANRERRYQNASEIRTDLQRLGRNSEVVGVRTDVATRWKVIVPAAVAVGVLFVAGYFYFHRAAKLTDTDEIVLADFANTTGDPVFDGTLRQGLAIQLEQSPFLKIIEDQQVQQNLRLMSLPAAERITNPIAHEICVREGAAATIDGSIANFGSNYVITLEAIACQGGATLAREQVQAQDKEHVLNAMGTAVTAMRAKLGESLGSIGKLNLPLQEATTPSLEALQAYTKGLAELDQGHFLAAVPLAQRAIGLDPKFVMAYSLLAGAFYNAGDAGRAREYIEKAFASLGRVSAFERDLTAVFYYDYNGELDKSIDAGLLGSRDYPRQWVFHNNSSLGYLDHGNFEEGLREGQEALRLQPRVEPPYRRLLDAYMCLDKLDEAEKVAQKARALGIDGARIHQRFLEIAYIKKDQAAVAREIQWYSGKPTEYISFGLQAAYKNVLGQRRESSKLYQRAAQTALRQGLRNVAAELEEADARADALSDNCQPAHRLGRPALASALCGDFAQAETLADETSKFFPNGTIWNEVQHPEISAAIELKRDHPAKADELLLTAVPYERAYPEIAYLRGLAYLRQNRGVEAAVEFQKILAHKGANWGSTWLNPNWGQYYSLSYLGLAHASALAGDKVKAKKAFQDFFELWGEADSDIPILKKARVEYSRLH